MNSQTISIENSNFRVDLLDEVDNVGQVIAIHGLPDCLVPALARISQVVEVPHTWRVRQVPSVEEVTESDISLVANVLRHDQEVMGAHLSLIHI